MSNVPRLNFRKLLRETGGAEIAEAAAVLPVMFMIVLGIFWFGQAFRIYGTITRAAQDGARAAAAPYCMTCTSANTPAVNASNAVQAGLQAAHLDPSQITPLSKWTPPTVVDCVTGSAVACTDKGGVCVQTNVLLVDSTSAEPVCGVSVSFEYPYQFWLPFTTLNQQQLQLQAIARVKAEVP
ncbi:MAG TPA: TadE/TadG family type IV pilus assembly protein [Candidatus Acidoferrales bacterium]|jgi:Flp pilus assembly protein TadG|nr:TadE/TadG family type IV pilus assembly protein [Candidatus Acidoferrales bacterium]